jgi:hypothetical protein
MSASPPIIPLFKRGGLYELAHGETLRFIAATVGGVPDYREERRTLIDKARILRLGALGLNQPPSDRS